MTPPATAPPHVRRGGRRPPKLREAATPGPPVFHRDGPVRMTKAEWETFSETAPYPHEWLGRQPAGGTDDDAVGEVRPVHGYQADGTPAVSTEAHSTIASNLTVELGSTLRAEPFAVHCGMLAVRVPDGPYCYPDVLISPYPGDFEPHPNGTHLYLRNPLVVAEILSPSTSHVDLREKRDAYLRIDSVTDYLLVRQDRPHVTHLRREEVRWNEGTADGLDASLSLTAPAAELPLEAVYRRVVFAA